MQEAAKARASLGDIRDKERKVQKKVARQSGKVQDLKKQVKIFERELQRAKNDLVKARKSRRAAKKKLDKIRG